MLRKSDSELRPRNGQELVVGIVARISGCPNQKEVSLEDQLDHGREVVAELYDGPVEFREIATKGKGERLDRPELAEVEKILRSRELDLLVMEDVGRLVRGTEAVRLWGIAVDHGTRCIAPNDCCDSAEETWEEDLMTACRDHLGHNSHTSKRIKHKKMNRFKKFGGATPFEIFGYIKPEGAKTYDDWQRVDSATPIIREGLSRLRAALNCSAVADWFNQHGVPLGEYCRRRRWDGAMVRRYYRNSLLKGQPGRGFRHTVKHYETGRRISVKNPSGPVFRDHPHLAHVDPTEFDEVNARLAAKNARLGRKPVNGVDIRWQVPRKRTRFPGQHSCCWYCGRQHVWGGNGIRSSLTCKGSRDGLCWNSVSFDGRLAVTQLVDQITAELYQLHGFDEQYRELVQKAVRDDQPDIARRRNKLQNDEQVLAVQKVNLQNAILQYGPMPMFEEKLEEFRSLEHRFNMERRSLERIGDNRLQVPASLVELRGLLEREFAGAAIDSPEFGDLLRKIVTDFRVHLVRLCDGGHLLPKARVKLALDGIVPDTALIPGVSDILYREFTLELFEPPERERIREAAVSFASQGLGPKAIAARITDEVGKHPTATAVQNALALDRLMKESRLLTPYVHVTEPPEDYKKLRRHKNARYRFTPLDGYVPPTL